MVVFGKTDIGQRRVSNQDEYRIGNLHQEIAYGLVCDGMGGEKGGHIASQIACEVIEEYLATHLHPSCSDEKYKDILISAVSAANIAVYDKSLDHKNYIGMGTTTVLVVATQNKAYVAHVGDSRVYMLNHQKLTQITKDHSLVQVLLEQGEITPDEVKNHPQKNMITRAVGISCFVDIDYIEILDIVDTFFLLCSDGLTNACSDEEIKNIILHSKKEEICINLIKQANQHGASDNITAVMMI